MNWLNTFFVLLTAFLAVFWEASFPGIRHLTGAQIDLLPGLMVYAGLSTNLTTICLTALLGGLWFDSLSANPLGVSVLPLFFVGFLAYANRELILREQTFARSVLGLAASAGAALLSLLILLTSGHKPLLGWGTIWQVLVMSVGGAVATPVFFEFFDWLNRTFAHNGATQTSFRPDREIRRGR